VRRNRRARCQSGCAGLVLPGDGRQELARSFKMNLNQVLDTFKRATRLARAWLARTWEPCIAQDVRPPLRTPEPNALSTHS